MRTERNDESWSTRMRTGQCDTTDPAMRTNRTLRWTDRNECAPARPSILATDHRVRTNAHMPPVIIRHRRIARRNDGATRLPAEGMVGDRSGPACEAGSPQPISSEDYELRAESLPAGQACATPRPGSWAGRGSTPANWGSYRSNYIGAADHRPAPALWNITRGELCPLTSPVPESCPSRVPVCDRAWSPASPAISHR